MGPSYSNVHNRFKYNGYHFNHTELKEVAYSLVKEGEYYEKAIGNFLIDWLSTTDAIEVQTSGSTGISKTIKISKQAMVNSAIATGDFFKLKPGDSALHCLPSYFIAGKMMLVRAIILGLEIDCVEPVAQPIFDSKKNYDFCAMIPLQVSKTITNSHNIKIIIIGGASLSQNLLDKIKNCANRFYETYGMTETVTHVAIKPLLSKAQKGNGHFKALPEITFSKDERDCLVIYASRLTDDVILTNDIVDLKSIITFRWLGRYDLVINSGGVKLFPEQIEQRLQSIIKERFIIASQPDTNLGEKLILIIENPIESTTDIQKRINALTTLKKLETPQLIFTLDAFVETENSKIERVKTISKALA
jgi:O-succinylbenzoic acid--CoA ligase